MSAEPEPEPAVRGPRPPGERGEPAPEQPWLSTAIAAGHLLLAVPLSLIVSVGMAGLGLVLVGLGPLILRPWVTVLTSQARVHARMASSVLGRPVPVNVPEPDGSNPWSQLSRWAGTRALWQVVFWLLYASTAGLLLSALVGALPFGAIAMAIVAVVFLSIDAGAHLVLGGVLLTCAVVAVSVWLLFGGRLLRWRCAAEAAILAPDPSAALQRRVDDLSASRAETLDESAAELRRIERDLHDGAQARLVALGMNLGMAADLLDRDPELARQLLQEARRTTGAALGDLRAVVRGIHPPVLADRGLVGAVQALALDLPVPVTISTELPARPTATIETAVYFAVAECLANVAKHAGARRVWVEFTAPSERLRVVVGDDGRGGASPDAGSGLRGITRRLAAFDGTVEVSSPPGGPTVITLEVPCAWSSPRTMPSYGTA